MLLSRRPRVAIYTAIFGAYDDPKPTLRQSVPTDFYLFSDRQTERAPGWRVEVIAPPAPPHPRMQAKWFRMHPHKLFPSGRARPRRRLHRYDFTIWLDASMTITSANFAREAIAAAAGHELACFGHPWRDCIFEEAKASIAMPHKYGSQDIAAQARAYREQGHPEHGGLFATGLLVRSTRATRQPELDEAWWRENVLWTYQDQLSLPVVPHRAGASCAVIAGDIYRNPWFRYTHHHRDS